MRANLRLLNLVRAMTKTSVVSPILIAGCMVLLLNFAIRASFGVFQIPVAAGFGWPRSDLSLAIAIQNLAWGDRTADVRGDGRTVWRPEGDCCGAIDPSGMLAGIGITSTSIPGAVSISVIGLFNIAGSILAGYLGKRYAKKYLLAGIYTARTIVSAHFIMLPMTPATVLLFSVAMGSMWLATVPLTSGLVARMYGIRYMGTLYGFVFLSHQMGSFLGVWLGGKMYDLTGDYTMVWWIGVGVGAFSALIHLPVREKGTDAASGVTLSNT